MTQSLPKYATPTITKNGDFEWDAHTKTCATPSRTDELKPIIFSKFRKKSSFSVEPRLSILAEGQKKLIKDTNMGVLMVLYLLIN